MTLESRIQGLRWTLEEIREIAEEHAEGGYGSDGQRGNAWNAVLVMINATLAKDEGKAPW
jgi:hypothetical protein